MRTVMPVLDLQQKRDYAVGGHALNEVLARLLERDGVDGPILVLEVLVQRALQI